MIIQAWSPFLLDVHRASRHMQHADFRVYIFSRLKTLLDFDSGLWLRVVLTDSGPLMLDHHLDGQPAGRMTEYVDRELWHDDPFMSTAFKNGPYRAWAMSAETSVPPGPLREYLERYEQWHVVCGFEFEPVIRGFAGFAMFRGRSRAAFNEHERTFVEMVEPHLRDAWTHNWLRSLGASRPDRLHADFAQAVFRSDYALIAADELFRSIVRLEWPQWQGPMIPPPWAEHLEAARATPWIGRAVAAFFSHSKLGMVLLRVRAVHAFDLLPRRHREVALSFAAGESQRVVADRLGLSPSTVNNYLVEVYRALDVADKSSLALLVDRLQPSD